MFMPKLSLENKLVFLTGFVTTLGSSLGYFNYNLPNNPETIVPIAAITPLVVALGNSVIQKFRKNRELFSGDNLKNLGLSYAGGIIGGAISGYCWYEALRNFSLGIGI